eukprot:scaffold5088_cov133-Skeletonema_menzelii.AAC.4
MTKDNRKRLRKYHKSSLVPYTNAAIKLQASTRMTAVRALHTSAKKNVELESERLGSDDEVVYFCFHDHHSCCG